MNTVTRNTACVLSHYGCTSTISDYPGNLRRQFFGGLQPETAPQTLTAGPPRSFMTKVDVPFLLVGLGDGMGLDMAAFCVF